MTREPRPVTPALPLSNGGELRKPHMTTPALSPMNTQAGSRQGRPIRRYGLRPTAASIPRYGRLNSLGRVPVGDGNESGVDEIPAG